MDKTQAQNKAIHSKSKDGFDGKKRWGNSAMKGHGVNSPATMEARAKVGNKKYPIHEKEGTWLAPNHWRGKNVGKNIKSTSESRSGFGGRDNS